MRELKIYFPVCHEINEFLHKRYVQDMVKSSVLRGSYTVRLRFRWLLQWMACEAAPKDRDTCDKCQTISKHRKARTLNENILQIQLWYYVIWHVSQRFKISDTFSSKLCILLIILELRIFHWYKVSTWIDLTWPVTAGQMWHQLLIMPVTDTTDKCWRQVGSWPRYRLGYFC